MFEGSIGTSNEFLAQHSIETLGENSSKYYNKGSESFGYQTNTKFASKQKISILNAARPIGKRKLAPLDGPMKIREGEFKILTKNERYSQNTET